MSEKSGEKNVGGEKFQGQGAIEELVRRLQKSSRPILSSDVITIAVNPIAKI